MKPRGSSLRPRGAWLTLWLMLFAGAALADKAPLSVRIEGLSGPLLDNARAMLGIDQPGPLQRVQQLLGGENADPDQTEAQVRRFYRGAPERIREALKALGYYNARIDASLERRDKAWQASFKVDPGAPVRIASDDVQLLGAGAGDKLFQPWIKSFPLRKGAVLDHGKWQDAKRELLTLARNHGYLDAKFSIHQISVDPADNQARLALHLDTGPQFRFGALQFSQSSDALDDSLLQRYANFKAGEAFDTAQLADLQQALLDSGYFSDVDIKRGQHQDSQVPIDVTLTPAKRYDFSASLGFDTDTGPRTQVSWRNRRLNSHGHALSATAEASALRQGASIDYTLPMADPLQDTLDFGLSLQRQDTTTSYTESARLGGSWIHKPPHGWSRKLGLDLVGERYRVAEENQRALYLVPSVDYSRSKSKGDPLMPTRGWKLDLRLSNGIPLSGSVPYLQGVANAKWIRSLGAGSRLLLHGEVGATAVSDFDSLPVSARFFTGGADSLRGFRYQSVGPRDANGNTTGGRYLAVGGVEVQYPIAKDWSAAVFSDVGNVARQPSELNAAVTAGVGVQWHSPVGPIRLYLAAPISGQGDTFPLVVTMGPDL